MLYDKSKEKEKISFNTFLHKLVFVDFLFGSSINQLFVKNLRFPYYFTEDDFYGHELGNKYLFTLWNYHHQKCVEFMKDKNNNDD